jgi:hypothetical protein
MLAGGCNRHEDLQRTHRALLPATTPVMAHTNTPPPLDVLGWIHRDSELVIGINVAQLRGTALGRTKLVPWMTGILPHAMDEFRERCGLDLFSSLETVTVGLRNFTTTVEGSLVIRGLEAERWWGCLRKTQAALRRDGFDPMWSGEILSIHTRMGNGFTVVPERDGLVRGTLGIESSAEDVSQAQRMPPVLRFSSGFRDLYERLDGSATGWFLMRGTSLAPLDEEHVPLDAIYGSVTVSDKGASEISGEVRLHTSTAERAGRYAATARARLSPAVSALFSRFTIAALGDDTVISMALTPQQLLALLPRAAELPALLTSAPAPAPPTADPPSGSPATSTARPQP